MQTFIADIIPKIQRFSQKLDNLVLLTNQHWVVFNDNDNLKIVYIFRSNNQILISKNGEVEKGNWELVGNNSLLIDLKNESYLFKHGFFDANILALKLDGKEEYAFLINESKYSGELNSITKVIDFLKQKYIENPLPFEIKGSHKGLSDPPIKYRLIQTKNGDLFVDVKEAFLVGAKIYVDKDGNFANDGKYKMASLWYIHVESGKVIKETIF